MARPGARFLAGAWLLLQVSIAAAADQEVRDFSVHVDGKPAGDYHLTIRPENGTFVISGKADVRVRSLVYTYVYSYRGTEVWKDGRLTRLESATADGRKRFTVVAWADGEALRVKVNGQERVTRPDLWTTSYWRLPAPKKPNQAVGLLDVDNGREIRATLQLLGFEAIPVAGKVQNCAHYRVTGDGVLTDLWYDAQERLARQELVEDGHRTVLELIRLGQ